jgi:hypothetical protein
MMAICPAGPPKLMKPSLSQKRKASEKETEEAGREVSTKKVYRVASAWTGHRQSVKLREAEIPLNRMVAAASPGGCRCRQGGRARCKFWDHAVMTSENLRPTAFIDSDHPAVQAFAAEHARGMPAIVIAPWRWFMPCATASATTLTASTCRRPA